MQTERMTTDAEHAKVLIRRSDDIERATQDWYGEKRVVEEIAAAMTRAIELLEREDQP